MGKMKSVLFCIFYAAFSCGTSTIILERGKIEFIRDFSSFLCYDSII